MNDTDPSTQSAGYRRPPTHTRFRKGQSGNLRGRPRGQSRLPYNAVLGQLVAVRENGRERRMSAEAAFLELIARRGLEGDGPAGRATMASIERVRAAGGGKPRPGIDFVTVPTFPMTTVLSLDMARWLQPSSPTSHFLFNSWLVQAALDRLGDKRLNLDEQKLVVAATRAPRRVRWPEWWEVKPKRS